MNKAAGAAVLAGRQLGAKDSEGASRTVTTIIGVSVLMGILLCIGGLVFMFDWGLDMGVAGASFATTVSQFITFFILTWSYVSGRSVIKIKRNAFQPSWKLMKTTASQNMMLEKVS